MIRHSIFSLAPGPALQHDADNHIPHSAIRIGLIRLLSRQLSWRVIWTDIRWKIRVRRAKRRVEDVGSQSSILPDGTVGSLTDGYVMKLRRKSLKKRRGRDLRILLLSMALLGFEDLRLFRLSKNANLRGISYLLSRPLKPLLPFLIQPHHICFLWGAYAMLSFVLALKLFIIMSQFSVAPLWPFALYHS